MAYKYPHFIPQNIAPKGAKRIVVSNTDGSEVCAIPLGRLTPPTGDSSYRIMVLSDTHQYPGAVNWDPNTKMEKALQYAEDSGCAFVIIAGDLTQTGFYLKVNESDASEEPYYDAAQMAKFRETCSRFGIPVFVIPGNHESYFNMAVTLNLDKWAEYTGHGAISYTISSDPASERNVQAPTVGDDLYILLGQPTQGEVMSNEDFAWFKGLLAANPNRRCFVVAHSYIEQDSGDPGDYRENSIFDTWGASNTAEFMDALRAHGNCCLLHGHSHMKFQCQEEDPDANVTEKNGFVSIHIPSGTRPRDGGEDTPYDNAGGQGYIVDVYEECFVLNGFNVGDRSSVPLGTYRINTPKK